MIYPWFWVSALPQIGDDSGRSSIVVSWGNDGQYDSYGNYVGPGNYGSSPIAVLFFKSETFGLTQQERIRLLTKNKYALFIYLCIYLFIYIYIYTCKCLYNYVIIYIYVYLYAHKLCVPYIIYINTPRDPIPLWQYHLGDLGVFPRNPLRGSKVFPEKTRFYASFSGWFDGYKTGCPPYLNKPRYD